jgi:hypothetical protein
VVSFLQSKINKFHVAHPNAWRIVNQMFWEAKMGDVDRSNPFHRSTIIGSWKAQQVKSVTCWDPTMLEYKDISCFCV